MIPLSITAEKKIIILLKPKENKLPICGAVIRSKIKKTASEKKLTTFQGIDILILGIIHDCPLRMVPYIKGITIRSKNPKPNASGSDAFLLGKSEDYAATLLPCRG